MLIVAKEIIQEWIRQTGRLYLSALSLQLREINYTDLQSSFTFRKDVKWTFEDFWNIHNKSGTHSFVLTQNQKVVLVFTIQFPPDCKCDDKEVSCLKLLTIAKNMDELILVNAKIGAIIILAVEDLATTLSNTCMELDARDDIHKKPYYFRLGYEDCDATYRDGEELLYPMRKFISQQSSF